MTQEDDDYWKEKVKEARRTQLETVRTAAAAWTALFAAVLGVFGAVTFAGGLTTIDKLPAAVQPWVKGTTIIAAILALIATVLAGVASSRLPKLSDNTTFSSFRDISKSRAVTSYWFLRVSRWLGSVAAALVIAGSITVIVAGESPGEKQVAKVVAVVDGKAVCAMLVKNGDSLEIDGQKLLKVSALFPVENCP